MSVANKTNKRSLTRLVAAQTLYQYDFYQGKIAIDILSRQLLENYWLSENDKEPGSYSKKVDNQLLENLLSGVLLPLNLLDEEIKLFLKDDWKIETLPDVMLPILRLATFELKFLRDIPIKVVINEYVDLAASFYDTKKVTFVNSILQKIADKNRANHD